MVVPPQSDSRRDGPRWDAERRELWFGPPEALPEVGSEPGTVLAAFQELGWPSRIDDPLPPGEGVPAEQRLRDTVKNVNRTLRPKLIRFCTDATGRHILWRGGGSASSDIGSRKAGRRKAAGGKVRRARRRS